MTKPTGVGKGGARKGAGRKPSGRVSYLTRLHPNRIAWIKRQAAGRKTAECEIVEEAIDEKRARTRGAKGKKP